MAEISKTTRKDSPVSPIRSTEGNERPESPTTAQPLDFDDDQDMTVPTPTKTTAVATHDGPKPPPKDEAPPNKPPRPVSPRQQAENTLKEAFPTIEQSVIRAVLTASGGQVEPAFNALLGMSDPDSQREPEPPARPPRPVPQATTTQQSQLEADEMYARQLQEHLANTERSRPQEGRPQGQQQQYRYNENLPGSRIGRPGNQPEEPVKWRSFIDDDLPMIGDNIRKGFLETQTTVNKWITNFKKTIDGEDEEEQPPPRPARPLQAYNTPQQYGNRRSGEMGRRSADLARYDADPQVIGDDFSKLNMQDGDHPPRTSSRPPANPNLFRPGMAGPRKSSPASGRKVSFQEGPPEEIRDMYSSSSTKPASNVDTSTSTGKGGKWQPLSQVDPSPVAEHDPFSLGDSDDEKDAKPITMQDDEGDKPKKATVEAGNESTAVGDSSTDTKK